MKLLDVANLNAWYGPNQVLFDLNFDLKVGGITTILGANGAGKTTTLRAVCQAVQTTGSITFIDKRIDGKATEDIVRVGIAHVPDGRGTFMALTVEENLKLGAYTRKDRHEVQVDLERMYLVGWRTTNACHQSCAHAAPPLTAFRRAFFWFSTSDRERDIRDHASN